jgi:signal transduction histidine kinase
MSTTSKLDHHILENWPGGLIIVNHNGEIQLLSQEVSQLTQWSKSELKEQNIHELLCAETFDHRHERENCPLYQAHIQNAETTRPGKRSTIWKCADEHHINIDYQSACLGIQNQEVEELYYLITFEEIEDRYNHETLNKLAHLSELNPAPLLEIDDTGIMQFSNAAMTQLMLEHGFNEEGQPNILPSDFLEKVTTCIQLNKTFMHEEAIHGDYAYLWQFHPYDNTYNERSVLICGTDISASKKAQAQELAFQQQLEHEKQQTRRDYIAKMIHDLRSPLNAVVGFADLLASSAQEKLTDKEQFMLEKVINGATELAEQISQSLDLSRVESAQITANPIDCKLNTLIQGVVDNCEPLAIQKGLELKCSVTDMEVRAAPQLIGQALTNLLANAIKYTDSGTVTITNRQNNDNYYQINVADTGCGIPADEIDKVFKLYQRTKAHEASATEGQGLGLSIVHDIATLHGGKVSVLSKEGKGSIFTLTLPLN